MSTELTTANFPVLSPMGSLDAYIGHVNRLPMLTLDEEQSLARRLREEDDVDAARDLILSHLRFVVHVARGYKGYGLAIGDLIQEGNIGLMKAVKRFDPDVGVRLVSFAVHWIRAEMHEFILKNWRIVKVATTKAQRKLFFNLRKSKKRLGWLNSGEVAAVAEALSVKPSDVLEMEKRLSGRDIAFDQPADSDDDTAPSPAFFLPHADDDPESVVVQNDDNERRMSALGDGLAVLDARSRDIVQRRWLVDDRETLQTLADEYGVSAERIRQIEAAAMKKIRTVIEA